MRTTTSGINVCSFTVAVNRRGSRSENPEADYFRVSAWRELGDNCHKYLAKGRKVCVIGDVRVSTYTGQDGVTRATMEVNAQSVEFLTPRGNDNPQPAQEKTDDQSGFSIVETDELPF